MYPEIPRMKVDQMLNEKPDAVLVETDDWLLMKYAQMCVNAGFHVHVDKPAGDDVPAFRKLLGTAKRKGLIVQMAYMYRYNTAIMKALELVRAGCLGEILQFDAVMSTEHPLWIRQWLQRFPGGTMHTFGCHLVDLALLFQGVPNKVTAYLKQTGLDGIAVNDHDLAVLEYPRGVSTIRVSSFEVNGFGRRQVVICGTEGSLELKPLETNHFMDITPIKLSLKPLTKGYEYYDMHESLRALPMKNRHDLMLCDFAAMIHGKKENPYSYEYEALVQNVSLAACGYPVDLTKNIELP